MNISAYCLTNKNYVSMWFKLDKAETRQDYSADLAHTITK